MNNRQIVQYEVSTAVEKGVWGTLKLMFKGTSHVSSFVYNKTKENRKSWEKSRENWRQQREDANKKFENDQSLIDLVNAATLDDPKYGRILEKGVEKKLSPRESALVAIRVWIKDMKLSRDLGKQEIARSLERKLKRIS